MINGKEVNPAQPFQKQNFLDAVKLGSDALIGGIDKYRGVSDAKNDLHNTAVSDAINTRVQASLFGLAESYVNKNVSNSNPQFKANVTNYIFSGHLPKGTIMQNGGIISTGNTIMKANGINIRSQPIQSSAITPIPKNKL